MKDLVNFHTVPVDSAGGYQRGSVIEARFPDGKILGEYWMSCFAASVGWVWEGTHDRACVNRDSWESFVKTSASRYQDHMASLVAQLREHIARGTPLVQASRKVARRYDVSATRLRKWLENEEWLPVFGSSDVSGG